MKIIRCLLLFVVLISCQCSHMENSQITMCNPINLDYRFSVDNVSRRDGAHPCIILYKDEYYLFMSDAGGYYHSNDLLHWNFISTNLPVEENAPTVVNIEGELYFTASGTSAIYKTDNPINGQWEVAVDSLPYHVTEPMLFYDEGRLFLYSGSGNSVPLTGVELDPKTFFPKDSPLPLIVSDKEKNGWEVAGDYHTWKDLSLWIEGTWMTKYNNRYYLQYASSGIQFKGSNEGVYLSDNPLGPFTLAKHNPFAYKSEGFINGVGNGCVFQDRYGNYWYAGTIAVTAKCLFERRVSLYPVFFDKDSVMYAYTGMGDYPMLIPDKKISTPQELFPGWMLLSYNKVTRASSELRKYPACCAVDENIRSWWSAGTGDKGEYLSVDLGEECEVYAIQVNFADHDADVVGHNDSICYQYYLEQSDDGKKWEMLKDKFSNTVDAPHDYFQLEKPIRSRYFRIMNIHCFSGKFSISGFRVFGKAGKLPPEEVKSFRVIRDETDRRNVTIKWKKMVDAVGYNIRYGTSPDKLYHNYMVYGDTEVTIRSLHTGQMYYFTIDSFNEGGITYNSKIEQIL